MADAYKLSAPRLPESALRVQKREIEKARETGGVQHGPDELVMIVNEAQQTVYASPTLLSVFCGDDEETFCGKHLGELFGCIHAGVDRCGATENCRYCGAAAAILDTHDSSRAGSNECVIQTKIGGRSVTYNFRVRTIHLEIGTAGYIMLLLDDIGSEKQREALERIFFHDILNTVTGLMSHIDLLERDTVSEPGRELVERIGEIAGALVDEIRSQRLLSSAENGTLSVNRQFIVSGEFINAVLRQYAQHDPARDRKIRLSPLSDPFSFVTDETILRRVLGNMVKNALEAAGPDQIITVGYGRQDGNVVFHVHNPGAIPHGIKMQIFNRFFSTKGSGRGLGTYSMKLLAEEYLGGSVWFTTDAVGGTTFYVSVPLEPVSIESP